MSKGKNQLTMGDQEVSEVPRNIQDLEANSKILDFQNKTISSAYIGPYPIGKSDDPTVTMRSVREANDEIDKKMKQKQYVKELEEQIMLRDKIKKEEEEKRNKKFNSNQLVLGSIKNDNSVLQSPTRETAEEV